ncbi:selenocysteine-specific translation elongation factor [Methanolinea mesophila]|uniref:EF-Tu/IF-2/RF-3 family GTPase n=1 Tax=Methanolinea mesophila TaxID=547055 RepID=UPI001AE3F7E5|nr:EF-Tu/IF-2/RF-3 family GTPase [Methanolinea mesophila]MBP1928781.1 selenocysteine-specific translation elongation factor [Methanolinea mesophila]
MPNLNVAVIGPIEYAKELGKKGTVSDITFYNLKKDETTVTFIEPSRYPEKLSSLFFAVSMAQKAVLVVDEINAQFGECVLMLDCAGMKDGVLVLRNYITPDQVAPLIRDTVVAGYRVAEDDRFRLREDLTAEAAARKDPAPAELARSGAVPVDHFFNVKGVGVVVLGGVIRGAIRKHDSLKVFPTEHTALVRSIQKHDDDVDAAWEGDRVGLALKGVEVEALDRGYVLSNDPSLTASGTIHGRATLVKYWPTPLKEGMILYLGHWMQFVPGRIAYVNNAGDWKRPEVTLRSEKELVLPPKAEVLLHYLEGGKLRIVGTLRID